MTDAPLSAEEHEFHYNPQRAFPEFATYRQRRAPANDAAHATLRKHADIAYGDHARHRLDIYPAAQPGAPVHVFFHGGYWRANDKESFAFIADTLVRHGITAVIANYELCPGSTLDGTVDSAVAAVEWVLRHIAEYGGDPAAVSLSGHSAGAHLCAAILAADWAARGLSPAFRGAVMISGVYDPTPAMGTTVNTELRLTPEIASRQDYERRAPTALCPAHLFAGGREPWRWIDLTFRYAHHLRRHGADPEVHVLPGYNHFDILDQYMDAESSIFRAVLKAAAGQTIIRPAAA
ncbi:alpha/beta hydrolase [Muricoccus radiodurans]|uniref:alpha/beta hydrolase n=1 Tax=Muricoccus radiodurans TaxID=2231721 RepID=UPI003CF9DD9B